MSLLPLSTHPYTTQPPSLSGGGDSSQHRAHLPDFPSLSTAQKPSGPFTGAVLYARKRVQEFEYKITQEAKISIFHAPLSPAQMLIFIACIHMFWQDKHVGLDWIGQAMLMGT